MQPNSKFCCRSIIDRESLRYTIDPLISLYFYFMCTCITEIFTAFFNFHCLCTLKVFIRVTVELTGSMVFLSSINIF